MSDIYNFNDKTQFIKEAKDNTSITQNIYTSDGEIEKKFEAVTSKFEEKLESIISKQDEAKISQEQSVVALTNEIQIMLNEVMSVIGMAFERLDANEQQRYESLKHKEDWESTLTLTVPLLDKLGIKIESKTKLENLIEKAKTKIDKLRGKYPQTDGLETNEQKHLLES